MPTLSFPDNLIIWDLMFFGWARPAFEGELLEPIQGSVMDQVMTKEPILFDKIMLYRSVEEPDDSAIPLGEYHPPEDVTAEPGTGVSIFYNKNVDEIVFTTISTEEVLVRFKKH